MEVLLGLGRLYRSLLQEIAPCLGEEWAPKELLLLYALRRWSSPTELGRALAIPLPTISQHLRQLEARGLILRTLDPQDLRRFVFHLTPEGKSLLAQFLECLRQTLERRLDRLDAESFTYFLKALEVLSEGGEACGEDSSRFV